MLLNKELGRYKYEGKWYQIENQTTVTKQYLILSIAFIFILHFCFIFLMD